MGFCQVLRKVCQVFLILFNSLTLGCYLLIYLFDSLWALALQITLAIICEDLVLFHAKQSSWLLMLIETGLCKLQFYDLFFVFGSVLINYFSSSSVLKMKAFWYIKLFVVRTLEVDARSVWVYLCIHLYRLFIKLFWR